MKWARKRNCSAPPGAPCGSAASSTTMGLTSFADSRSTLTVSLGDRPTSPNSHRHPILHREETLFCVIHQRIHSCPRSLSVGRRWTPGQHE